MEWINSIKDALFFLNLYYDKDRHAPSGWNRPEEKETKKSVPKQTGVRYTSGQNIPYREDENGTRTLDWGGKDPSLTDTDMSIIEDKKLDKDKYAEIKGQWAVKNMTAAKASSILQQRHGKGYGARTVQTYWSAINAAFHPSPTV